MFKTTLATVFSIAAVSSAGAATFSLEGTLFDRIGAEKQIDPYLLYAVTLTESAYSRKLDGSEAPYPWVLRFPDGPEYYDNWGDAEKALLGALSRGVRSVDIGMAQINCKWHCRRVKRPEHLLDPATNLRTCADILNEEFDRTPNNLIQAIGRYHSTDKERNNRYGLTVWNVYRHLKDL